MVIEPPVVSHAQKSLLALIKERRFIHRAEVDFGLPHSVTNALYHITVGRTRPTYGVVYKLRERIQPAAWFFTDSEPLPPPYRFKPIYRDYSQDKRIELSQQPSAAHALFDALRAERFTSAFSAAAGLKYNDFANYVFMRKREDGLWGYRSRPVYPFIRRLRHIINPDLWFIFPDELLKPLGIQPIQLIELAKKYGAPRDEIIFQPPKERRVLVPLKTEVLEWLGPAYQSKIADILENAMKQETKKKR